MNGAFQESIRDDSTLVYQVYEPVLRYARISFVNQLRKFLLVARRADEWNTERLKSHFRRKYPTIAIFFRDTISP